MKQNIVFIIIIGIVIVSFTVLIITGSRYYFRDHWEEYIQLSSCESDEDCVQAMQSAGPGIDSLILCTSQDVIDRFDDWIFLEADRHLRNTICYCNMSINKCSTEIRHRYYSNFFDHKLNVVQSHVYF